MLYLKGITKKLIGLLFILSSYLTFSIESNFSFIENKGQLQEFIKAKVNLPGGALFIEQGALTYNFYNQKQLSDYHISRNNNRVIRGHAYSVLFNNSNNSIDSKLEGKGDFFENHFIGNDRNTWVKNVHHYETLVQTNVYDGIDLQFYKLNNKFKYDIIINSYANPENIELSYKGVEDIFVYKGDLHIKTSVNSIVEEKPFAYQIINGIKKEIICNYILKSGVLSFEFPNGYDESIDLVIDPTLVFSTYSGSIANNFGYTATYDDYGFLYSGSTAFGVGYPTTLGSYQVNFGGGTGNLGTDIAITKYDTTGTKAIYSTYLGGGKDELPHSMIVNSANELFVFGTSGSDDFPITYNAYQSNFNGGPSFLPSGIGISYPDGCDLIVSRLSSNGGNLLASTYIGGSKNDGLNIGNKLKFNYADEVRGEIDIDKNNNIYIATSTFSDDFPIVGNVFQSNMDSLQEGVIIKMDNQLGTVFWSTFLGGKGVDAIYSLALDPYDNIYVTGGTTSNNFPTSLNALYPNYLDSVNADAFVSYISKNGDQLISSTYYGSDSYDQAFFVELDLMQNVYLFGQTKASGNTLIYQANYYVTGGGEFISKLSKDLDSLLQSTVVGVNTGKPNISPTAFLVDVCNKIYIAGWGSSIGVGNTGTTFNLPITRDAFQRNTDGNDFYLMVLDDKMSNLIYATYFGGDQATEHVDGGTSRFDKKGIVYQCVCAGCGGYSDFPTTFGAASSTNNAAAGSQCNSAVFKFDFDFPTVISDFSAPWVGCDSLISFQNLSKGAGSTTFNWFFGDGDTSTLKNPTHIYNQDGIYDVKLITIDPNSCNFSDTIVKRIFILTNSSSTIPKVEICKNEQAQIGLLPLNDPTVSYVWLPSYGLSNSTVSNPLVNIDSTILYQLIISNGACSDTIYQLVDINSIDVNAGNDTTFCNDNILLTANTTGNVTSFLWSSNNLFIDTLSTDSFMYTKNTIRHFIKVNDSLCHAIDSIDIKAQNIDIHISGHFEICKGDSAFIKVNNLLPNVPLISHDWTTIYNISYSQDSTSIWIFPDTSVWVYIEVQNFNGCRLQDSIYINVSSFPIYDSIWASKNPIYKDQNTLLNIETNANVIWENGDSTIQIEVWPNSDSIFIVEVYNDFGCKLIDSIFIEVLDVFCDESKIIIPSAFSPNNDEELVNEVYRIIDNDQIINHFRLQIYNRFGQKVFNSNNKDLVWDGTYKGELLSPQVFDFYLELKCFGGKRLFKKGNITLIR